VGIQKLLKRKTIVPSTLDWEEWKSGSKDKLEHLMLSLDKDIWRPL